MSTVTIIRRDDGQTLVFDNSANENWSYSAVVTSNRVEESADFSDHVQVNQLQVNVQGIITTTPKQGAGEAGQKRVDQATEFLKGCFGKILTVGFARDKYVSNVLLQGFPFDVTNAEARTYDLSFIEAQIAVGRKVLLGGKASNKVKALIEPPVDAGVGATVNAPEAKGSFAATIMSYFLFGKKS